MNTTSRKRTAVFEIDLSTVIGAGATCNRSANVVYGMDALISFLTAPLGVRATGATVYDLQCDWIRVASFAYSIVGAVGLCLDKFDAFTTRKIVIKISCQRRPELKHDQRRRWISKIPPYLRVIISIWCRKISTKSSPSWIFAEQRVRRTKSITGCTK